ncbi:putative ABC transporter permease [Anaerovorax odorimutans]|uniref:putative ABC transporter permease n=1 Tax=Anaerovorax odorimutans TaxID=109327 RepID=UPI00055C4E28|nr:hypothetical protein [Anaerovorax odorimutans]
MLTLEEKGIIFFIGAIGYGIGEVCFRGYTHWSMLVTGGFCFLVLYIANIRLEHTKLWKKCILGAILITCAEFIVGCIVNLWLDWHVWNYSRYKVQFLGQICLPFSILWFIICFPVYKLSSILHNFSRKYPIK